MTRIKYSSGVPGLLIIQSIWERQGSTSMVRWSEKIAVTYQEWLDCMCGRQVREEVQQKILSQIADPDSELVQYVKRREELHRRVAHGQIDWVANWIEAIHLEEASWESQYLPYRKSEIDLEREFQL